LRGCVGHRVHIISLTEDLHRQLAYLDPVGEDEG
jgi:hypothetical protein